ncbi:hypothetical protein ACIQXD_00005, partial [Streptomyces uncialis]|uniref:hypothetical protein n=1 Tax=Streptomyces uncialis TaxID=1048205 RepID=UPI0037F140F6
GGARWEQPCAAGTTAWAYDAPVNRATPTQAGTAGSHLDLATQWLRDALRGRAARMVTCYEASS